MQRNKRRIKEILAVTQKLVFLSNQRESFGNDYLIIHNRSLESTFLYFFTALPITSLVIWSTDKKYTSDFICMDLSAKSIQMTSINFFVTIKSGIVSWDLYPGPPTRFFFLSLVSVSFILFFLYFFLIF